ncbi:MAG: NAD(P)(+) transhydrogenase (Re/Si-specific) subunit alpha, partial [Gammaproteobacteria bacterium]
MLIAVPRETWPGELRSALVPQNAKKLISAGFEVAVETGAGERAGFPDADYVEVGAAIESDRRGLLGRADIVFRVRKPDPEDVAALRSGVLHISFLDPFNEKNLVGTLAAQGVTAISMEMIPRTTLAQKMDALSSQANLAGYVTVIHAAYHCPRIFPMMMTPAGTIAPARV